MDKQRKYFGTDGIRGHVGELPISAEFVLHLGWAVGRVLASKKNSTALIAKDTRISGYMFESALEAGLSAAGVNIKLIGPLPTPGLAYLTKHLRADIGIMISASHNPHYDNGFKFFTKQGLKLPDSVELSIEEQLKKPLVTVASEHLGKASRLIDAIEQYGEFCKNSISKEIRLEGLKIVLDCANGATYHVAPDVFKELGANIITIHDKPDGLNINRNCGSTHPKSLQKAVLKHQADLGIAFDGDGDRVIMVDHCGEILDGDELLFIIAYDRFIHKKLKGGVVGTVMSNMGMEHALRKLKINFVRAKVGDRYVLEQLQQQKWKLGGESSGHIISLDKTSTGDGIIAALQVVQALVNSGKSLHELKSGMEKYPQVMRNIKIKKGSKNILSHKTIQKALKAASEALGEEGRVLLRASGTEPLIRVMVEGQHKSQVTRWADELASIVSRAAG